MKAVIRMFSTAYPYHLTPKINAQKLIDFPIQFYSNKFTHSEEEKKNHKFSMPIDDDTKDGIQFACGEFLSIFGEGRISELKDLVEFNLFKKLDSSWKNLKDSGCSIKLIGNTENPTIEVLDSS